MAFRKTIYDWHQLSCPNAFGKIPFYIYLSPYEYIFLGILMPFPRLHVYIAINPYMNDAIQSPPPSDPHR